MNWRLVSEVLAYIATDSFGYKYIAFSGLEKKEYSKLVLTKFKSVLGSEVTIIEKSISSENFEAIIDENSRFPVMIKSSKLPGDDFYRLINFDYSDKSLLSLLGGFNINCSKFVEPIELVISSELGLVRFVQKSMSVYKTYHNELVRRINCEIFKKTTKWIPGHRYDNLDETYYYLGLVSSHTIDSSCSEFTSGELMKDYHLVVTEDISRYSSLEEIIKYSIKNKSYKLLDKTKLMVDSGDFEGFDKSIYYTDLIDGFINWAIDSGCSKPNYNDLSFIMNVLRLESPNKAYTITSETKLKLEKYLSDIFKYKIIPSNWERPQHSLFRIYESNTLDQNTLSCFSILIRKIEDDNVKKQSYFEGLFKHFKIDIFDIIKTELQSWLPSDILNDFDKFCEYSGEMYEISKPIDVVLRTSASCKYSLNKVTLSEKLVETTEKALFETIKNIVSKTRSNIFGNNVKYRQENVGTLKSPMIYECFTITLDNILDYYKEEGLEIPENLKNEIILNKFCRVEISVDKDGEII